MWTWPANSFTTSGPVDPVGEEVVGPAGPTTATRMDGFTEMMLRETGLLGMVGKAERGPVAIDAIQRFGAVYLMAVGGAAYLVSKAIRKSRVVAFEDLGMEAIHEFEVEDMPVTVAVDSRGHLGSSNRAKDLAGENWPDPDPDPCCRAEAISKYYSHCTDVGVSIAMRCWALGIANHERASELNGRAAV